MASFTKFQPFVEKLAEKAHNLGSDQLKVALTSVAPTATDGVLADLTEIAYTNLSAREITTTTSAQTGGTYKLVLADLTLEASGGAVVSFRYIVIYNDTAANDELIAFFDKGVAVVLEDEETLLIDFSADDGVLTLV